MVAGRQTTKNFGGSEEVAVSKQSQGPSLPSPKGRSYLEGDMRTIVATVILFCLSVGAARANYYISGNMLAAWRFARDAPLMRSVRHLWAEPVRPRRALEKAEFDQYPDRADDRDKGDKHPPAGFVAVVKAFDIDDNGRDQRDQREDAA